MLLPSCHNCRGNCAVKYEEQKYFGLFYYIDNWVVEFHDYYFLDNNNDFIVLNAYLNYTSEEKHSLKEIDMYLSLESTHNDYSQVYSGIDQNMFEALNQGIIYEKENAYFGAYRLPFYLELNDVDMFFPAKATIKLGEYKTVDLGVMTYNEN